MQGTVLSVAVAEGDSISAGRAHLRGRGDEDGERDRVVHRRRRHRAARRSRGSGLERSGHLRARVRVSAPSAAADLSELAGEQLGATATTAENWLLVEVPGTWPRDVADGAGLPDPAREAVRAWLETTPSSRLLFIRRPGRTRRPAGSRSSCAPERRTREVRRFALASPDELADVDLERGGEPIDQRLSSSSAATERAMRAARCAEPRSTARSGRAARRGRALALVAPGWPPLRGERARAPCWESSSGASRPRTPRAIVARALAGRIDLAHYRGRTRLRAARPGSGAGGADARELDGVADLELVERGRRDRPLPGRRPARSTSPSSRSASGPTVPASCGADPEPQAGFVARVAVTGRAVRAGGDTRGR